MTRKPRVVFDTNVYISAILFGGNPRQCLELSRSGELELYTTRSILLEITRKMRDKFLWPEEEIKDLIEGLSAFVKIVSPRKKVTLIKETPEDNRILECALEVKADHIISGDKKHLLSLGTFKNIPIFSAKHFLDDFYRRKIRAENVVGFKTGGGQRKDQILRGVFVLLQPLWLV